MCHRAPGGVTSPAAAPARPGAPAPSRRRRWSYVGQVSASPKMPPRAGRAKRASCHTCIPPGFRRLNRPRRAPGCPNSGPRSATFRRASGGMTVRPPTQSSSTTVRRASGGMTMRPNDAVEQHHDPPGFRRHDPADRQPRPPGFRRHDPAVQLPARREGGAVGLLRAFALCTRSAAPHAAGEQRGPRAALPSAGLRAA